MAASQEKIVTMVHEREADHDEKEWLSLRVPVEERSEPMRYLMRRATWAIGVAMCAGVLGGVMQGCLLAVGMR